MPSGIGLYPRVVNVCLESNFGTGGSCERAGRSVFSLRDLACGLGCLCDTVLATWGLFKGSASLDTPDGTVSQELLQSELASNQKHDRNLIYLDFVSPNHVVLGPSLYNLGQDVLAECLSSFDHFVSAPAGTHTAILRRVRLPLDLEARAPLEICRFPQSLCGEDLEADTCQGLHRVRQSEHDDFADIASGVADHQERCSCSHCDRSVRRARPDIVVGLQGQDEDAIMVPTVMHCDARNTLLKQPCNIGDVASIASWLVDQVALVCGVVVCMRKPYARYLDQRT